MIKSRFVPRCTVLPSPPSTSISKEGEKKIRNSAATVPRARAGAGPVQEQVEWGPFGERGGEGKAARLRVGSSTWQPEALAPAPAQENQAFGGRLSQRGMQKSRRVHTISWKEALEWVGVRVWT